MNSSTLNWNVVIQGYGGDRIGALLLSRFVKAGSASNVPYNHYSLLRTLEDMFGLPQHLGYAADNPASGYHVDSISNDANVWLPAPSGTR